MYKIRKNLSVQIVILIGLIMVAGMFFKYASEVYKDYKINTEINTLKENIEQLKGQNEKLTQYLDYLDTDSYKEIIAKQDLNLRRPNEKVIIIKSSEEVNIDENETQEVVYTNIPIHMKWWNMFIHSKEEKK